MIRPLHDVWWRDVRWALAAFLPFAAILATTNVDEVLAAVFFFDPLHAHWLGADNWWVNEGLHTGGRWFVRVLVAFAACAWLGTYALPEFRVLRRQLGYFVVAVVLAVGSVGLLKTITNVDCPWDLLPFGGSFPAVHLFADRPDGLRHAQCFPAAHASSGYALVALYFVWRESNAVLARIGLCVGVAAGVGFGVAQQSRGAHFMSHDVWSAFIVWLVAATVYAFGFGARLAQPNPGAIDVPMAGLLEYERPINERVDETLELNECASLDLLNSHDPSGDASSCDPHAPLFAMRSLRSPVDRLDRNGCERGKPACQRCPW